MQTAWRAIPDGDTGVLEILAALNDAKNFYGSLPCIRAAALCLAAPEFDNANEATAVALARFVRSAVRYTADPVNSELTHTPDVLLLAIDADGCALGDCDDHCLLFASLAEACGVACEIVGVQTPASDRFDHVIVIAWIDGAPCQFDLVAKQGPAPVYDAVLRE